MKATKYEVFLSPQFIRAGLQYLNTDGTLFSTASPSGLLIVSTEKPAAFEERIAMLVAYVRQYSTTRIHVVSTPCNYEGF